MGPDAVQGFHTCGGEIALCQFPSSDVDKTATGGSSDVDKTATGGSPDKAYRGECLE